MPLPREPGDCRLHSLLSVLACMFVELQAPEAQVAVGPKGARKYWAQLTSRRRSVRGGWAAPQQLAYLTMEARTS